MRINAILLLMALLAGAGLSCRRAPAPAPADWTPDCAAFSGARALAEAVALAEIVPRVANTPGAGRAAEHLAGRFRAAGAAPVIETFVDPIPGGTGVFRNLSVEIPGSGSNLVLLVAHYDTKGGIGEGFMGANDSGSGMGMLIELARLLAAGPAPPWTVRLVALDGEECALDYGPRDGLHGSRREAARLRRSGAALRVRAVILLDMVGDRDLTLTLPRNGTPELLQAAFDAARAAGVRDRVSLFDGAILDDHVPFMEAGMPAVDLIDFQFGSQPGGNNYWHTLDDRPDKLSAASLQQVGQIVLHMLAGLARRP